MPNSVNPEPTYNLWSEPWIMLEHPDGESEYLGIEQTLLRAHEFSSIYEQSPLVIVGIQRLLIAILQDAFNPRNPPDLQKLWKVKQFPVEVIMGFGQKYSQCFDLFSTDKPFLQSADLSLVPTKEIQTKTVAYLSPELPAGTEITHYHHGSEDEYIFCPACAAGGLVTVSAFATSGGAGIKPSINGVPPIYVIPGGKSLFHSLTASLILPQYQPKVASTTRNGVWWKRSPLVEPSKEVNEVDYLNSLTFPARRVRLHPIREPVRCTRCGRDAEQGVRTMIFQMGESRTKNAPFWFDPFAAYKLPSKEDKNPIPIRPFEGKSIWREYGALFLAPSEHRKEHILRPAVLDQIVELGFDNEVEIYPFRCTGMRTDMKAKVFEWIDAIFEVPPVLLRDPEGGMIVDEAMRFASDCVGIIKTTFYTVFGKQSGKRERHKELKTKMDSNFWSSLANSFRQFTLAAAIPEQRETERRKWMDIVLHQAKDTFRWVADSIGDDAATLRQRVKGESMCNVKLAAKRKEYE